MTRPTTSSSTPAWSATDLATDPHEAADKARRVERMFAAIARRYDLNNRLHSFGLDQTWRNTAVRIAAIQPADDVLDVACGTGDLTFALSRARPRTVTGLDFTQEMLDLAIRKADRFRTHACPSPTFLRGDAMNLQFPDASFDLITIAFGIRNVAEPARAVNEFFRVLRPAGRLVILEFSQPRNPILRWLNRLYTHNIMPISATLLAADRSGAYRYLPRSVDHFHTPESLSQLVTAQNFMVEKQLPLTFGVCTISLARKIG